MYGADSVPTIGVAYVLDREYTGAYSLGEPVGYPSYANMEERRKWGRRRLHTTLSIHLVP